MAKICKFQIEKRQVSYDCGEVWEDTGETRKIEGQEPVERYSYDCGWSDSFLYRWVEATDETVCVGYHKYSKKYQEVSYNQGVDWEIVEGSEQPGTLMEKFSSDCCQLRTVTADTCDELFRYVNASIEEASLDGETWVQTGRYTVNSVISAVSVDCMNEYDVKYLGVPVSGTSGYSSFYYNEYSDSTDTNRGYDAHGWDSGYVLIKCGEDEYYSDDNGGYQDAHLPQIEEIYVGDCAVAPRFTTRSQNTLKKIHISSGATGSFGGPMDRDDPFNGGFNFMNCTGITEIEGLGESQITGIARKTFSGCTSLNEVTIPYTCRQIEYAGFVGCTSLTSATIHSRSLVTGREEIPALSQVGYTFSGCTSLQTVTFPEDYYGVILEGMFDHCTSLTGVTLGNPSDIGEDAFNGCTSLTEINLGNRVSSIGMYAFGNCASLTDVYIESTEDVSLAPYPQYVFPSGTTIHVPCEKYDYWRNLLPASNPIDCFRTTSGTPYCEGYDKYVDIYTQVSYDGGSTWETTATATTLVEAWSQDCGYVPLQRTISGTPYCDGFDKYVDIYTQVSYDGGSTWETTATTPTLVEHDSTYCGYSPLPKIHLSYINGDVYSAECSSNTTLTSDDTNPTGYTYSAMTFAEIGVCVTSIGEYVFYNCTSLTGITIPSGVTSIGRSAFEGCSGLTSITIPDSVTSIGEGAFAYCSGFTSIDIPSGVTSIGRSAFFGCWGLAGITVNATTPPTLGADAFWNTDDCPIYVPAGSVETYKSASGWSNYSYRIQAIQT